MSVRRLYAEKKPELAIKAKELKDEISGYLGISSVTAVRVLIRYDIENVSDDVYARSKTTIFSEPPVDVVYEESFPSEPGDYIFSVEYLPGQFDQRADSAEQCIKLLSEEEEPIIRSATTYILSGKLTDSEFAAIKKHCINPVDSREAAEAIPDTLITVFPEPADVAIIDGFISMPEEQLKPYYDSLGLAMTYKDFKFIQDHFANEEHRDPTITEIRVLDTYWSDHCRHTTFATEFKNIEFEQGDYSQAISASYDRYVEEKNSLGRQAKPICLMDIALGAMRVLKAQGKLEDQEKSDEINACSIVVPVEVDGKTEEWLVNFKNETHNHPTEIEPFGGAATCLGGAIRDPLSGRTYVYQAMRITGAADPRKPVDQTLEGKLPQKKLVRGAASGYSSYGNQIGLATGYVKEIYHPGYVAKRMEVGAVIAAAPRRAVQRLTSDPGDIIVLLGGRTGRDGCGGATGSSKAHNTESIHTCGAEVQKGNAPTERKLQRLFRREEVSFLIKKCNDFGAGGVSVAIGELADGLQVNLDLVPKKYAGLDGTELSISESQERMACVIAPENLDQFLKYAAEENLEATPVARVTEEKRLVLNWRGKAIVNISRKFLDTNGAPQETSVYVRSPKKADNVMKAEHVEDVKAAWMNLLGDLNVCSQKGLVEMFDSSIGAGTVTMPYGGKYQTTEIQTMVAKLPVLDHDCDTVTMMSYGFDPYLSNWSPYHGSAYAVVDSLSKIVAAGGDYRKVRFTFQEFFRRMTEDASRWGEPTAALLGAYEAQMGFGLPSIGGKDSMSGSFNDIDVPNTLISFAVNTAKEKDIITPEFKKAGSHIYRVTLPEDASEMPDFAGIMKIYDAVAADIKAGKIISAYVVERPGAAAAISKMAFGNKLGVKLEHVSADELFAPDMGGFVFEVAKDSALDYGTCIGTVTADAKFDILGSIISMDEMLTTWTKTLEKVFPTHSGVKQEKIDTPLYTGGNIAICKNKIAKPHVFIPVFPGTNCEYDTATAFKEAGAEVETCVFRNLSANDIRESVELFEKGIRNAQIVMFPGGFSAGDEPEGSAKFFATAFRNEHLKEAISDLLNQRDGLMLGICNGFQALIKLGLVPYGEIRELSSDSPTLAMNSIGRHISKMVYTRVVTNKSPWLSEVKPGEVYTIPASHGEGRFVADAAWLKKLAENGQIATQYVDGEGNPTMDEDWNPNGSYMAIEGITSPDGRILGKMAHCERRGRSVGLNIVGEKDMKLFKAGVKYFS